jgi:galactokinase
VSAGRQVAGPGRGASGLVPAEHGSADPQVPTFLAAPEPVARAKALAQSFAEVFGGPPAGVWAAPGRVNLIGEHTDYNGGLCLPIALPHSTFVAAGANPGRVDGRSLQRPHPLAVALDDVGPGHPPDWGGYVAGAVAMLREAASPGGGSDAVGASNGFGLQLLVDGDVPVGAGLSSSAALSCAAVLAADDLAGLGWAGDDAGRSALAQVCVRAENEVALAPTGGMDQTAALRSRAGHATLLDCRDGSVRQVPFDVAAAGLAVLVIDTRAGHKNADGQYAHRRAACEEAARALGVATLREVAEAPVGRTLDRLDPGLQPLVRHVISEIGRVNELVALLDDGRLAEAGPVLDASHASLRDDYRVSCRELDVAVEAARAAGALGARMTGGGFGGSALALVRASDVATVADAVHAALLGAGPAAPNFLLATAGSAGRRVW